MYLTFRRSRWFAPAYAANDLVLTVLWAMASVENRSYLSALVCFVVFFVNDLYGFINWGRIVPAGKSFAHCSDKIKLFLAHRDGDSPRTIRAAVDIAFL